MYPYAFFRKRGPCAGSECRGPAPDAQIRCVAAENPAVLWYPDASLLRRSARRSFSCHHQAAAVSCDMCHRFLLPAPRYPRFRPERSGSSPGPRLCSHRQSCTRALPPPRSGGILRTRTSQKEISPHPHFADPDGLSLPAHFLSAGEDPDTEYSPAAACFASGRAGPAPEPPETGYRTA